MKQYLMYLRKSRADRDAVDEPVMQTLQRHKARLDEYCQNHMIFIPPENILFEVSSADSIASRPLMMELLSKVESGAYEGVLCVDMDRLSRGSGADQALVINTFKYSNTKIITPLKTYDFNDETDEQFAELGLFIGRNEYRMIKRRLRQGKIDAAREGKYPAANPPYGYKTYKLPRQKGFSLEIIPEEAEIVRLIFDKYTKEQMGGYKISRWLNDNGFKDQFGNQWSAAHVGKILRDPTYTGKIRFANRVNKKEVRDGVLVTVNRNNDENKIVCPGLHQPIISEEQFQRAVELRENRDIPHVRRTYDMSNPLCGLVQCAYCGKFLALRSADSYGRALYCPTPGCKTRGAYLEYVEDAVLKALREWMEGYTPVVDEKASRRSERVLRDNLNKLNDQLVKEHSRKNKIHDLFERDIYSLEEYQERIDDTRKVIQQIEESIQQVNLELDKSKSYKQANDQLIPTVRNIVDHYDSLGSASEKNVLLKQILEKVVFDKTASGRTHGREFTLTIFPKIPKYPL